MTLQEIKNNQDRQEQMRKLQSEVNYKLNGYKFSVDIASLYDLYKEAYKKKQKPYKKENGYLLYSVEVEYKIALNSKNIYKLVVYIADNVERKNTLYAI